MSAARRVLKEKLARRDRIVGVGVEFPSPALAERLAASGFDLVFIDCEHGGPGIERVADMARAVRAGGGASVLRPWSRDLGLVRRYLDSGVDGIVAPEIASAAEARAIAEAITACDPPDAADIVLIPLIESAEGVGALDAILAVPGVDGVQVGPADLAVSLGLPRRSRAAQVTEISLELFRRAAAAGRSCGGPVGRFGAAAMRQAGANILMVSAGELLCQGTAAFRAGLDASAGPAA